MAQIDFEEKKPVMAIYHDHKLNSKEVGFFMIGELLLSTVAVKELNQLTLSRFAHYIRYFKCKKGLIFNFNAVCLDFRYLENDNN